MPKEKFIELLGFCLKTHFTFDGTTYEQVKGTPVGSPVSSVIAEEVEETPFRISPPTFWARYVDDTFTGPGGSTRRAPQQHLPGRSIHHGTRKGQTTALPGRHGDKDN